MPNSPHGHKNSSNNRKGAGNRDLAVENGLGNRYLNITYSYSIIWANLHPSPCASPTKSSSAWPSSWGPGPAASAGPTTRMSSNATAAQIGLWRPLLRKLPTSTRNIIRPSRHWKDWTKMSSCRTTRRWSSRPGSRLLPRTTRSPAPSQPIAKPSSDMISSPSW